MTIEEGSWRLRSSPGSDIERSYNGAAMSERIHEWLATPEGTVANHPSWGHNLKPYLHDPIGGNNTNILVRMEMAIARKMADDIDGLQLLAVNVEAKDIDLVYVTVVHQYGEETLEVSL